MARTLSTRGPWKWKTWFVKIDIVFPTVFVIVELHNQRQGLPLWFMLRNIAPLPSQVRQFALRMFLFWKKILLAFSTLWTFNVTRFWMMRGKPHDSFPLVKFWSGDLSGFHLQWPLWYDYWFAEYFWPIVSQQNNCLYVHVIKYVDISKGKPAPNSDRLEPDE